MFAVAATAPMGWAALTIAALMVATWAVSVALKNASIVDIVWGLGFVLVAWVVRLSYDGVTSRQNLLVAMATIWGLRLSGYLWWRNHGKGEDYRYKAMRKRWGPRFWLISLGTVFGVQATIMFLVSLPVQLGQTRTSPGVGVSVSIQHSPGLSPATPSLGLLALIGVAVWLVGLFFEAVGDAQLARFKKDPANAGKVMDKGLWRYTRHPNYFGDACVWWGIALVAAEVPVGRWGIIGAVVMTVFLRRVSGVTLLEKSLVKRREGYTEYVARTSPFVPRPPRAPKSA